jgi:general secretion pathway protein H
MPHALRARGFTLVELLVVLVILGCVVGLVVLSTGLASPERALRNEAERLAGLIGVVSEEAVLDNRDYGIRFEAQAYQVLRHDPQQQRWQALGQDLHRLPAWAVLSVELEGEALRLAGDKEQSDAQGDLQPQLVLLSSGELSPFRLLLAEQRRDGVRLRLSSDGFRLPVVERLDTGRAR